MAKSGGRRGHPPLPTPSLHRTIEGYGEVSTPPLDEVIRQWGGGQLTPEQAIGSVMQHLAALHDQVTRLRVRLTTLEMEQAGE
jgi:hypothetical protein